MDNEKLIAIAIAAGIGALLKEVFTIGIKYSATVAKKLIVALPAIISKNLHFIDLVLNLIGFVLFVWIFYAFDSTTPGDSITVATIRFYVLIGIMMVVTASAIRESVIKLRRRKEEANKDLHATPRKRVGKAER